MAKRNATTARNAALSCKTSPAEIFLADIKAGMNDDKIVFRLVHFWEARNPNKGGMLIGLELLLIDEKGTVIQGFIAPNRVAKFEASFNIGSIYSLTNFFATPNKTMYRVSDQAYTICFTDNSLLFRMVDQARVIDPDRFRFWTFEQFESGCTAGAIYIVGHLKLINGYSLHQLSGEKLISETDKGRVSVHLQPKEGPIVNINLWDKVAAEFRRKFATFRGIPSVLLVTTLNPKNLGGMMTLASMSSSRVFFDMDVLPTREYLTWFETHGTSLTNIDAAHVVKAETLTIREIQEFLATKPAQNLVGTILDVATAAQTKGDTTLLCPKCNNPDASGVIKFRLEYSVQDKDGEATFVFLDEAAGNLIGRKALELMDEYTEGNGNMADGETVPIPDCLSEVLNQTHKFELRISIYNFRATRQTFTVTKIIAAEDSAGGETNGEADDQNVESSAGKEDSGTSIASAIHSGEDSDFISDLPSEGSKRPRLCS